MERELYVVRLELETPFGLQRLDTFPVTKTMAIRARPFLSRSTPAELRGEATTPMSLNAKVVKYEGPVPEGD